MRVFGNAAFCHPVFFAFLRIDDTNPFALSHVAAQPQRPTGFQSVKLTRSNVGRDAYSHKSIAIFAHWTDSPGAGAAICVGKTADQDGTRFDSIDARLCTHCDDRHYHTGG